MAYQVRADTAIRQAFICLKGHIILIVIGTAFNKIKLVVIVCCVVKAFASNEIPHSKIKHILDVNNLKGHVISFGWTLQEDVLSMYYSGYLRLYQRPLCLVEERYIKSGGQLSRRLCKRVCCDESLYPQFIYLVRAPLLC